MTTPTPQPAPKQGLIVAAAVLALAALGVSGYLSIQKLTGNPVAGCGGDDGCGAVLASPWSMLGPLPVSLLGSVAYLAVLAGLGMRWFARGASKPGDFILLASAPAMLIAAGWFTYVQAVEIQDWCPYCMVDHGIGVVLAVLLALIVLGATTLKPVVPLAVGVLGVGGIVGLQVATLAEDVNTTKNFFADRDSDITRDGKRYVSMFGGELQFVLQDSPYLGDPGADQVVGLVFDYACPHCRGLHTVIADAIEKDPSAFVVVPLPVSIHEDHDPYIGSSNERFVDSYELAMLSMAVFAIDKAKWKRFDHWLFAPEDINDFPRSAKDARDKAVELVGEAALDKQMSGGASKAHRKAVDRNIALLGEIAKDDRRIPIVTSPGAPHHLTERFYDIAVLEKLLKQAAEGLKKNETDGDEVTGE